MQIFSNRYQGFVEGDDIGLAGKFVEEYFGIGFNVNLVLKLTEDYSYASVVKHGDILARWIQDDYESFLKSNSIQCDSRFFQSRLHQNFLQTTVLL